MRDWSSVIGNGLLTYTIYCRPKDHPNHYVVREWAVARGAIEPVMTGCYALASTLDGARELLPSGLCRIPRDDADDSVIVETWL